ncbi:Uncharacterised protein [Klebsiella pneumoniae]|nr:Uncharacterised protein [Klebsiella pneumoniae]
MARPWLMPAVTSGVTLVISSATWRTSRWLSWLRPAWLATSLMKTWALPRSFSIIALLLCREVSFCAAWRALRISSRLVLKSVACWASVVIG